MFDFLKKKNNGEPEDQNSLGKVGEELDFATKEAFESMAGIKGHRCIGLIRKAE